MANQVGGTRMDTVVKLVLIFFIALLSFAVGTFVGKGVSDSEYREAALERGDYKGFRETASVDEGHASKDPHESLSEEEIKSLTEEFVNNEKAHEAHPENDHGKDHGERHAHSADHHGDQKAKETHKGGSKHKDGYKKVSQDTPNQGKGKEANHKEKPKTQKEVDKAVQRVAQNKAPMKDVKAKRGPDSSFPALAQSAVGKYTVQVASYPNEQEAKKHAATLKAQGVNAFYLPAMVKNQTWYRVSVGFYANYKSAVEARKKLLKDTKISRAIVSKIVK